MNRASLLIQELLGLAEKSAEPDISLTPKQKANDDHGQQVGTTCTMSGCHHINIPGHP